MEVSSVQSLGFQLRSPPPVVSVCAESLGVNLHFTPGVHVIIFIPFNSQLKRAEFSCGNALLDSWLRDHAGQNERRNLTRTVLGFDEEYTRIASYFTLVTHRLDLDDLATSVLKGPHRYPVPTVLIAQLAVDTAYQGTGLGRLTLVEALSRLNTVADSVGFQAVVVDAIDAAANQFYRKFGFVELTDDGRRLFLSTSDLRSSFDSGVRNEH